MYILTMKLKYTFFSSAHGRILRVDHRKYEPVSSKIRNKAGCRLSPLLLNMAMKVIAKTIR
jgi:hypothetical protein